MAAKRNFAEAMQPSLPDMDYDGTDNPNEMLIRFKWLGDGASSIDDIIERLKAEISWYTKLKYDGWELQAPIVDDYGYLVKNAYLPDDSMSTSKRHACG